MRAWSERFCGGVFFQQQEERLQQQEQQTGRDSLWPQQHDRSRAHGRAWPRAPSTSIPPSSAGKDPRFKPSMLEPPGPKYREVVIDGMHGGPIVKTIHTMKTGLEPKRPFKWGQLGSYY